jgi:glycyl-tRNA synthetase beta chain
MNFLLEIGTEEIPHWMIPGALKQLSELNLLGAQPRVDATPRRLVVQADGVPERTPDEQQIVKGPPLSAGERAAAGFAKKQGVELSALVPAGEYYELRRLAPGRRVLDILSETLPTAILGIQWPKTMYWTGGKTGPRFIRPIRWIVALLGDHVIPFEIAGVKSGNVTRGHRQLGSSSIPVTVEIYESELRRNFVILSSHERRHKIEKESAALGAKIDADLLETLTFITEYPTAIRGDFDSKFLELPAEVLTTVMRHHQKYFSVESAPNLLAPNFVAVMNTAGDPDGLVKHGNERVLKARFNDARFFWDVDQVKKLADRVEDLKKVTFHVKLGSYFEKTERVVALVKELGGNEHAQRAALLCKADLTAEMVKEFTELQGVVGGLYARAQGEPEPVALAMYQHYQPASMEDSIPETLEGQIVSLADKIDTLRECFRIGMVPTGSKDPFALRRAAQGVVKILAEAKLDYSFRDLFVGELADFMLERIQHYFREIRGYKYDEVNAVLAAGVGTLALSEERLEALSEIRKTDNFEPLAISFKRIRNILEQAKFEPPEFSFIETVDPDRLEPADQELDKEYRRVNVLARDPDCRHALASIASIRPAVDRFFNEVLVNSPDPDTRRFRLTLLNALLTEFSAIADFTKIVTSGEQK